MRRFHSSWAIILIVSGKLYPFGIPQTYSAQMYEWFTSPQRRCHRVLVLLS